MKTTKSLARDVAVLNAVLRNLELKKLTLGDLQLGIKVNSKQLDSIYDIHIILKDAYIENEVIFGTIAFIGPELTLESDKISKNGCITAHIFNSSIDAEEGMSYDE